LPAAHNAASALFQKSLRSLAEGQAALACPSAFTGRGRACPAAPRIAKVAAAKGVGFTESFGAFDILWVVLALGSAFTIGRGGGGGDEDEDEDED